LAVKTFTGDRPPTANDGKFLRAWHLSQGAGAQTIQFCNGVVGSPIFEVQLPANTSASQIYHHPICFPNGLHVEVVATGFIRGGIDLDR
jgi:hypothetical protein